MLHRFRDAWVYGGSLCGIALLITAVGLAPLVSLPLLLIYVLLPLYMLHQLEEHYDDRFRKFVNRYLGGGVELLTPTSVFVINVPGVWGIFAVVFALSGVVHIGFGLISAYTMLVNAVTHIGQAAYMRRVNPGFYTGLVLFVPASAATILSVSSLGGVGVGFHMLGLAVAVIIHALIVGYAAYRRRAAS